MDKMAIPTREEAISLIERLIAGQIDPIEAAKWAEQFDYPQNRSISETLAKQDPVLRSFIDDISLAAAINEKNEFLYKKEDFQGWLDEFLQQIGSKNDEQDGNHFSV